MKYDDIQKAWEDEIESEVLLDLEDLRLSKMASYLSEVRLSLAETTADNDLMAELLTQEALNLEFMLKDVLLVRKRKIMNTAFAQRRPLGSMSLAEEDLYNRFTRGIEGHSEFVKEILAGVKVSTKKDSKSQKTKKQKNLPNQDEEMEYILVRFLHPINEAFMGLDEATYGPFKKEDVVMIPVANAKIWLRDGTVVRVITEEVKES